MTEVPSARKRKPQQLALLGLSIPFWEGGLCPRLATVYSSPSSHLQM